jgi:hypothetical protein
LEDIINLCIDKNQDLSFLKDGADKLGNKSSQLTQKFSQSFKQLLGKFIQIGLLNVVDKSSGKDGINFLKTDKSESMELFDQYLSNKVNTDVVRSIIEIAQPALVAHINQVKCVILNYCR